MNTDQTEPTPEDLFAEEAAAEAELQEAADPAPPGETSEVEKFREMALRARADLDNYRKRVAREKEDSIRYANLSLLERLLPVVDNFELGLMAARSAPDAAAVISGLDMVRKQLAEFLKDQGMEVIDAEGKVFDPNLHEAMGSEANDSVSEGSVIRQVRKGYKLRDRLLRPASVFVSTGPA
jgi:molecular chaperone GrpE